MFLSNIQYLFTKKYYLTSKLNWKGFICKIFNLFEIHLNNNKKYIDISEHCKYTKKQNFNNKNKLIQVACYILKNAEKNMTFDEVKNTIRLNTETSGMLNKIVSLKSVKPFLKIITKYLSENIWNTQDEFYYYPVLDCIKYSDLFTVKYVVQKTDLNCCYTNLDYNTNIICCAILNNDCKILKFIVE